jgi:type IV pilus assembly PilO-like protein
MAKMQLSTKRVLIDKTNSRIVAYTAIAAFMVVFTLVASKTLISQAIYQNRVISAKKTAVSQLKTDIQSTSSLVTAYKAFVDTPQNVIGGDPNGNGPKDGDNAKVVLDALPSKYDFPALATSLEKLLTSQNVQIQSISGTDDEVAQSGDQSSGNPSPVAMPFQISVTGNYQSMQKLVKTFNSSIRPFQVQTMQLSGDENSMTLTMTAQTFYQPEKVFNVSTEVVQ